MFGRISKFKAVILAVFMLVTAVVISTAKAASNSDTITLAPGWNVISTPKVLQNHLFSAPENSANFDIYLLNASSTAGWSTMAEVGQTEFQPLYGYFINNKTGTSQTLTLNYRQGATPVDLAFERRFTKSGWYSIGPANPTYAKALNGDTTDTNNAVNILSSLFGNHSDLVDFTSSDYGLNPSSVRVGSVWTTVSSTELNAMNDMREGKGYAIFVTGTTTAYRGFQSADQISAPRVRITSEAQNQESIPAGSTNVPLTVLKIDPAVENSSEDIMVTRVIVSDITSGAYSDVSNLVMFDSNGNYLSTINNTAINGTTTIFQFGSPLVVSSTASTTIYLRGDVSAGVGNTHQFVAAAATAFGTSSNTPATVNLLGSGKTIAVTGVGNLSMTGMVGGNAGPITEQNIIIGSVGVPVYAVRLEARYEPIKITSFILTATGTLRNALDISNVSLYRNEETVPFASLPIVSHVSGKTTFTWSNPENILPNAIQPGSPVTIYVKVDVGGAGQAILNDSFAFSVESSSDITARGVSSKALTSVTGAPTLVPQPLYIAPFHVVVSPELPIGDQTVVVTTGTELGRVRIYNSGSARITVSGVKFADSGTHTGGGTTYKLLYSDQNSENYQAYTAVASSPSADFTSFGSPFTLDAGAYRYLTVAIQDPGGIASGDTFKISVDKLGDINYFVSESDLGYDATGEGIMVQLVTGLRAEGTPRLGIITNQ